MAKDRFEIRIAGTGGQGVILATEIIGHAIALYEDGLYVVQTQAIGPEARGGRSRAEVVISGSPIDYPKAVAPHLQVILSMDAATFCANDTAQGGRIVYDDFFVDNPPATPNARVYTLPIVRTAREKIGKEIVTNMVALGCVGRVLDLEKVASSDSLRKAIVDFFPDKKKIADLNVEAFNQGYETFKKAPQP